jgi:mRNA-degrading endonuclease toxin of MazEF toxin-antitoxin module
VTVPPLPPSVRFGQVWESSREVIGPMRYLVVSSDAYNTAFADRRVIAVEVDSAGVYEGVYREPIVDAGTAHLDRLTWVATRRLVDLVAELHPTRHQDVARVVRELIGNP